MQLYQNAFASVLESEQCSVFGTKVPISEQTSTIMNIIVKRRIGPDPHEGGRKSSSSSGCPDILELDSGDFAIIGQDITAAAIPALPASAGCAAEERVIRIPREILLRAKGDIARLA